MPNSPSRLLQTLSQNLFPKLPDQEQFIQALLQPQPYPPAILWIQPKPAVLPFAIAPAVAWQPSFVDRLSLESKPGKHPLHDQGAYYCLDLSSVFAAVPLMELAAKAPKTNLVVDLCAAPGGKSLFAWRSIQPDLLLCNEVIGKRLGMLISNLKRCQVDPVAVLHGDVATLAPVLCQSADVVIVDAPCSGQSLLAKRTKVEGCFHPVTIRHNQRRQKRILAAAADLVAPQGWLLYSTCTFSKAENEGAIAWFLSKFPQFQPQAVLALKDWQSHLAPFPCYRLWPQSGLGAGAFTVLLHNSAPSEPESEPQPLGTDWKRYQKWSSFD
ncbi:RsmB/NOP family class I SAM-dependent RNA methyltransferase [Candidatus Synechococcus calcipolaris G9]|uniref:RsmB/NOP family class I SAM-dependent RNA methyltransferase n=1 Tax=Candidatus Synechococcus calcipolaris G9 TaxID=1497997 RepID=A0ABT6EZ10_9SYNE|nr:RsmB/NOP family class I SAM-dependent RNA methyltransferase [Candidatus Synechococcus calcipolaris]MDG2990877.1 RsmB/NOP family class I SAM-dependent RNA methyltransferase [Candidatus Synechococcus calcipolaris G9]